MVVGLGCVSLGGQAGLLSVSWGKAGGTDLAGLGVPATALLVAKPRGEDVPRRRCVYKTRRTSA